MKHSHFARIICLSTVIATYTSFVEAASQQTNTKTTETPTTETPITQTKHLETQAKRWSLTVSEYQRYQELMNGSLGKWNPAIDPLMALGMFATTPQQQQYFAERYAQQEFELTERTLRFQQTYREAFKRLYPNTQTVDQRLLAPYFQQRQQQTTDRLARQTARQQFTEGDRLLVFVSLSSQRSQKIISRLMGLVSAVKNSGVDIYVRNAQDDTSVRRWAQAHQIKAEWLDKRTLTLNRDEGLYQRLRHNSTEPSQTNTAVFLKRNDRFFQLSIKELGL